MKQLFCLTLVLGLACFALGQDYQDIEEKPISRLRSPRGPLIPNRANKQQALKAQTTTTTTTEAPAEEYDEANYDEEEPQQTTTTTEAPKKGIRGGVLRPFRSNTDLIEALKRRRAQAGSASQHHSTTTTTTSAPQESSKSQRRSKGLEPSRKFARNGYQGQTSTTEPPQGDEPTQRSRYFAGRGKRF
ncbi:uncharacterized protein LOC106673268 [Cimex lectularius]|uniref:Uncharacterized protein n=1 Tax=Cimex lectularius TaxID=79782 RepID=A0A8I6SP41_CIMLE|nr:uncharacterized protein LOC106673268 [Cimex lectularius]